ncbi:MAG: VOC family protein [Gammaproteobacteria bacterium]|nr:VOC family protein [Gammaproteobacteria bacterium]MDE2251829.1 VOC family protein [Gammaproteobacteria bacterium]
MDEPKKRINHVVFNVHNLDEAVKFYTEVVGMKLITRFDDRKMAFVSFGERHHDIGLFEVGGTPEHDRQWHGFNHLAMEYEGGPEILDKLHEKLLGSGAKIDNLEGHAGGRHKSVYFFDPDGNRLEFYWENPDWRRESAGMVRSANEAAQAKPR